MSGVAGRTAAGDGVRRIAGIAVWPPRAAVQVLSQRGLARDVALLQASNTLQKGYGLLYNAACFRLLGAAGYGEFRLVLTLYNTVNLLGTLGLGQFLVVPLAQAAAAGDREGVARACAYNVKLSLVISLGVMLVALAAGPWIGELVFGTDYGADLGALMRIVALGAVPSVGYTLSTTALQSVGRMRELALVENVDAVLFRALGIAALLAGKAAPGLLWGVAAGGALSALHALYQYRRIAVREHDFPGLRQLAAEAVRVPFGAYLRFSALAVADKNVSQFFGQTPMLFLGRWAGKEEAAYFDIAAKVFTLLAAFSGAASRAISVRLSQEYGANGAEPTRRLFWRTLLVWGGLSIVLAAGFTCLLPVFKWVYSDAAFPSLALVLIFAVLQAKQGFTVSLGAIFLILDRVLVNVAVKIPLLLAAMPIGAWLVQAGARAAERQPGSAAAAAGAYQLGAFLVGDLVYFSIIASPWFWRR